MKGLHSATFKVLAILIVIGAIASGLISWQRNQVETNARTVEMVYDYNNILENASIEKTTPQKLTQLYKDSGITSLAIYDETPESLVNHGYVSVYRGTDFILRHGNDAGVRGDRIYIQPVASQLGEDYFNELKKHLPLVLDSSDIEYTAVDDVPTIIVNADYKTFWTLPLGVFKTTVQEAAKSGLYLVLRPKNPAHVTREYIDHFLEAVDASSQVSAILSQGKEAPGYKDELDYAADSLKKRNIPIVLIEAQNQLGFEKQAGIVELAEKMDYDAVRLYAMSKDELIKLDPSEAASRFYISDIERNIRMNLFPSYKDAVEGETLSELNASYIRQVAEKLNHHGFTTGKASVMSAYFPNRILKAAAIAGAVSLCVLVLLFMFPVLFHYGLWIEAVCLAAAEGIFFAGPSLKLVQALALGCEVAVPVLVISLFMMYCLRHKEEAFSQVGWGRLLARSIGLLWLFGILSLMGALYVSALMSDISFFLEINYFRGVKATFVLPVLCVSWIYIQHFPFFHQTVASPEEFIQFVKKFCHVEIKLGLLIVLGLLAVIGMMFIGRSGNNGAPVPQFEITFRRAMETLFYARPREKEFLFGHPSIIFALTALFRKWPQVIHYLFVLAVTIGQGSIIETFAHMRSPFILSFVRGLNGLAMGTLTMVAALIFIMIFTRITQYFGEKYGRD